MFSALLTLNRRVCGVQLRAKAKFLSKEREMIKSRLAELNAGCSKQAETA